MSKRIFIIVNESPWGSSLATTAARFVGAVIQSGHQVPAVFFHDDGVYNAIPGRLSDDGLAAPLDVWQSLAGRHKIELLLCSAAAARRFRAAHPAALPIPFVEAGLAQMWKYAGDCHRVVSF